jgi:aryl-alcohol dehydrogenase-like predicted oxidoreductase
MENTEIGLGLAAIGRPEYINLRHHPDPDKSLDAYRQNAWQVLEEAYQCGIRHFDTAASYGRGEDFLMEWYKKSEYKDIEFSTKWGYTYVANWKIGFHGAHEVKEHSLRKLDEQWSRSKAMLPALKIYQIHSATFESGVLNNQEVLDRLFEIKEKHGIKIGLSVSGNEQSRLLHAASEINVNQSSLFDSFQVSYNILEQSSHHEVSRLLDQQKIIIVKEAMANGRLLPNKRFPGYREMYTYLEKLGKKYEVGVDAIALRFVMDNLRPTIVLSGASSTDQLKGNMRALNFHLNNEELHRLSAYASDPGAYWQERKNLEWN